MIGQMGLKDDSSLVLSAQNEFEQGRWTVFLQTVYRHRQDMPSSELVRAFAIARACRLPRLAHRIASLLTQQDDTDVVKLIREADLHKCFQWLIDSGNSYQDVARNDAVSIFCLASLAKEVRGEIPIAEVSETIRLELSNYQKHYVQDNLEHYSTVASKTLYQLRLLAYTKSSEFDSEFRLAQPEFDNSWYFHRAGIYGYMMLGNDEKVLECFKKCCQLGLTEGPAMAVCHYFLRRFRWITMWKVMLPLARYRTKQVHRRERMRHYDDQQLYRIH
jgi:hypothetical protein